MPFFFHRNFLLFSSSALGNDLNENNENIGDDEFLSNFEGIESTGDIDFTDDEIVLNEFRAEYEELLDEYDKNYTNQGIRNDEIENEFIKIDNELENTKDLIDIGKNNLFYFDDDYDEQDVLEKNFAFDDSEDKDLDDNEKSNQDLEDDEGFEDSEDIDLDENAQSNQNLGLENNDNEDIQADAPNLNNLSGAEISKNVLDEVSNIGRNALSSMIDSSVNQDQAESNEQRQADQRFSEGKDANQVKKNDPFEEFLKKQRKLTEKIDLYRIKIKNKLKAKEKLEEVQIDSVDSQYDHENLEFIKKFISTKRGNEFEGVKTIDDLKDAFGSSIENLKNLKNNLESLDLKYKQIIEKLNNGEIKDRSKVLDIFTNEEKSLFKNEYGEEFKKIQEGVNNPDRMDYEKFYNALQGLGTRMTVDLQEIDQDIENLKIEKDAFEKKTIEEQQEIIDENFENIEKEQDIEFNEEMSDEELVNELEDLRKKIAIDRQEITQDIENLKAEKNGFESRAIEWKKEFIDKNFERDNSKGKESSIGATKEQSKDAFLEANLREAQNKLDEKNLFSVLNEQQNLNNISSNNAPEKKNDQKEVGSQFKDNETLSYSAQNTVPLSKNLNQEIEELKIPEQDKKRFKNIIKNFSSVLQEGDRSYDEQRKEGHFVKQESSRDPKVGIER